MSNWIVLVPAFVMASAFAGEANRSEESARLGELSVRLVDAAGNRVDDALVTLTRMDDGRVTDMWVADERRDERFVFTDLEPGRYQLEARNEESGFAVTGYADVAEDRPTDLTLSLMPRQRRLVSGRVTRRDTPAAHADVWAQRFVWPQPLAVVTRTDDLGKFTLELPEPGEWLFEMRSNDWEISERGWNVALSDDFVRNVPGEGDLKLEFELPAGSISGLVIGPDSAPLRGHDVGLRASGVRSGGSRTLTDGSGRFEFRGLGAGDYSLDVGGPKVFDQGSDPGVHAFQYRLVRLTDEEPKVEEVVLALAQGGELDCEFSARDASSVANQWVYARPSGAPSEGWFLLGRTAENGRLYADGHPFVGGLPPGALEVSLRSGPGGALATPSGSTVSITSEKRTTVRLSCEPATQLRLRAIDHSTPLFLRLVELMDSEGRSLFIDGPESEFRPLIRTRPVPPGRYRIRVADPAGRVAEQEVELHGQAVEQLTFEF